MSDVPLKTYQGSCHCGRVKFELRTKGITSACMCNCSICRRKNAVMSDVYFTPDEFQLLTERASLTRYQFGDHDVNHYFCSRCGIPTFHDGTATPGHYRVNLGCLDDVQLDQLTIRKVDGANF